MKRKLALAKSLSLGTKPAAKGLLSELREMILSARQTVATTANATLTMLHWQIGNRIRKDILREKRAEYGEQILSTLSKRLEAEFGRGFGRRNLFNMVRFAEVFPDTKILQSLIAKLGWTHFLHLIRLDDPLKRDFYAEMCRIERWSTRTLDKKIGGMLFERTALSKKPAKLAAMELKQLREEGEEKPIGLILCAGKRHETIELLDMEQSGIRVSSYWTEILPKKQLERKLHQVVLLARARLAGDAERRDAETPRP